MYELITPNPTYATKIFSGIDGFLEAQQITNNKPTMFITTIMKMMLAIIGPTISLLGGRQWVCGFEECMY